MKLNQREQNLLKKMDEIFQFGDGKDTRYSVIHISIHPSKELCSKMAPREVDVSLQ